MLADCLNSHGSDVSTPPVLHLLIVDVKLFEIAEFILFIGDIDFLLDFILLFDLDSFHFFLLLWFILLYQVL